MCPFVVAGQQVEWSLFPNVDLMDFGAMNTSVNGKLFEKEKGGLDSGINGKVCGEVSTNANATLNAIPNAEDNSKGGSSEIFQS